MGIRINLQTQLSGLWGGGRLISKPKTQLSILTLTIGQYTVLPQHDIFQNSIVSSLKLLLLLMKSTGELAVKDSKLKSITVTTAA